MTRLKRAERDRESSDQRDVGKVSETTLHGFKEQCSLSTNILSRGLDHKEPGLFGGEGGELACYWAC